VRLEEERELKSPSSAARDLHAPLLRDGSDGYGLDLSLFYFFSAFFSLKTQSEFNMREIGIRVLGLGDLGLNNHINLIKQHICKYESELIIKV